MRVFTGRDIKTHLVEKGVTELFHANTVTTSISFLKAGGLLSRGEVENRGMRQTPQLSDNDDKIYNIWNDVFFDSCDIHHMLKVPNKYGPVCFVFSIDLLDDPTLPEIRITKSNPYNWEKNNADINYIEEQYIDEISEYRKNDIAMHITLIDCHNHIPFSPYLKRIILDNPKLDNNDIFECAKEKITNLICQNNLECDLQVRNCTDICRCQEKYSSFKENGIKYRFGIL